MSPRWHSAAPADWLEHWNPARFALPDGEIDLVECGSGPPLVLLPPIPGWKEAFVALAPLLARRHRVLTFDLRSRFRGEPSWDDLADDAEAIVAERVGGPVAVLGHSFGGMLALHWAARHPERVRSLVVSSSFARLMTPRGAWARRFLEQPVALAAMRWLPDPASAGVAEWLARRRRWVFDAYCDRAVVELVRAGIREVPFGLVRQRLHMVIAADLRASLPSIAAPTLVLHGEHDTAFAVKAADELASGLQRCERAVIAGGDHLHPLSRAGILSALVGDWLERSGAGR